MRTLGGLFVALLLAGALSAQYRGNITGTVGNVLYPAGTPGSSPFITSAGSNVVYPGGGGVRTGIRGQRQSGIGATPGIGGISYGYAYPVYVPAYDPSMYAAPTDGSSAPPAQQSPNVIVIYPPQGPPVAPMPPAHPSMQIYQAPPEQAAEESSDTDHYLFAFKDHSIYSVVAYWVDGDTLHYFTNANTHKQCPLSLLDRDLTERLNKESGSELKLPADKK